MAKEKKLVKAITPRDVDFAQWYTDVVREAELCDYSSVKGSAERGWPAHQTEMPASASCAETGSSPSASPHCRPVRRSPAEYAPGCAASRALQRICPHRTAQTPQRLPPKTNIAAASSSPSRVSLFPQYSEGLCLRPSGRLLFIVSQECI